MFHYHFKCGGFYASVTTWGFIVRFYHLGLHHNQPHFPRILSRAIGPDSFQLLFLFSSYIYIISKIFINFKYMIQVSHSHPTTLFHVPKPCPLLYHILEKSPLRDLNPTFPEWKSGVLTFIRRSEIMQLFAWRSSCRTVYFISTIISGDDGQGAIKHPCRTTHHK